MTESNQENYREHRQGYHDRVWRGRQGARRPPRRDLYQDDRRTPRQWNERYNPDIEERFDYELERYGRWGGHAAHYERGYGRREGVEGEPFAPESEWEQEFSQSQRTRRSGTRRPSAAEQEGGIGAPYGARYGGRGRGYDRGDFYVWMGNGEDREIWQLNGPYTGVGPKDYRRTDEHILEEVNDRLTQHGQLDATDIEVRVQNGIVKLQGLVSDRHAKRMAEDTADSVLGVRDVQNHLRINRSTRRKLENKLLDG
jgi:hypothetical protein